MGEIAGLCSVSHIRQSSKLKQEANMGAAGSSEAVAHQIRNVMSAMLTACGLLTRCGMQRWRLNPSTAAPEARG